MSSLEAVDWRLRYVNSINIARLYRRRKEFDEAERYYQRAFDTTLGVRSESDLIYTNICLAQLNHERGCEDVARTHWLRAAFHWAAAIVPEAIGARVAGALTGLRLGGGKVDIERIAEIFVDIISRYFPDLDRTDSPDEEAPAILPLERLDPQDRVDVELAAGCLGWGVLAIFRAVKARSLGQWNRRLRILLRRLAASLSGCPELERAGSLVVDDRFGREMPVARVELLGSCLRLGVPRMVFEGTMTRFDRRERPLPELRLRLRLGVGVDHVERVGTRASVVFKRYRPPVTLSVRESLIVLRLVSEQPDGVLLETVAEDLAQEIDPESLLWMVFGMEKSRILHLYSSENIDGMERLVPDSVRTGTLL
jgi:hypothetical protein